MRLISFDGVGRVGPALRVLAVLTLVLILAAMLSGALFILHRDTGTALELGITLAALPVPVYLGGLLWADRIEPEPPSALVLMFVWGAGATFALAYTLNTAGTLLVGRLHGPPAAEIYGMSVSAPVVEESLKAAPLFALLVFARHRLDDLLDGVVYAAVIGLGFATAENVLYYGREALYGGHAAALDLFVVRGVWNPFIHPLFTSATGIAIAYAATHRGRGRWTWPLLGLFVAVALHSAWNTGVTRSWFLLVYWLLFIPLAIGLALAVVAVRRREALVLAKHLGPALGRDGVVVAEINSLQGRRALRAMARRRAGAAGWRTASAYAYAGLELGFMGRRIARGQLDAGDERVEARRRGLRREFLQYEEELCRLGVLRPERDLEALTAPREPGFPAAPSSESAPVPRPWRWKPITLWFQATGRRDLVVNATNTGRHPVTVDLVGLGRAPWRRDDGIIALPSAAEAEPNLRIEPGASTQRTIANSALREHTANGRRWIHAGSARGAGRSRRIPAGLLRHLLRGPQ